MIYCVSNYPKYATAQLADIITPGDNQCGWNEGYSNIAQEVKYSNILKQISPAVIPPSRGVTLRADNLMMEGSVSDRIEQLKTRKRHRSSVTPAYQ